jgi:hypothetical protein
VSAQDEGASVWFLGEEVEVRMLGLSSITGILTDWNQTGILVVHNEQFKFIPWLRVVMLVLPKIQGKK